MPAFSQPSITPTAHPSTSPSSSNPSRTPTTNPVSTFITEITPSESDKGFFDALFGAIRFDWISIFVLILISLALFCIICLLATRCNRRRRQVKQTFSLTTDEEYRKRLSNSLQNPDVIIVIPESPESQVGGEFVRTPTLSPRSDILESAWQKAEYLAWDGVEGSKRMPEQFSPTAGSSFSEYTKEDIAKELYAPTFFANLTPQTPPLSIKEQIALQLFAAPEGQDTTTTH